MCGIFGILSRDPRHLTAGPRCLDTIAHRGPDDAGSWTDGTVFLGNRRLSIIDLVDGHQPIAAEDSSCVIVYNGELYNYLDLRPELEALGHRFRTHSDTEVILHAYLEWGVGSLQRFNGMFAFAIWDARSRRLLVARDRLGEKPLYYYRGADRLVFASEIKAIVADPTIPRRVNPNGLANYLAFGHAMAPDTMYEGIFKLPPGHYLLATEDTLEVVEYWDVASSGGSVDGLSERELTDRVRDLLSDSVRRRMIADVPVGAFLSGGLDSSAVAAFMCKHASGPVRTFSLGFTIGGAYNELNDARAVAQALGTEHHELEVDQLDMVDAIHKLVWSFDEPFGDAANLPVYLLSKFARQSVKVVLAGEGGDELFGGYRRYVADRVAPMYQLLPRMLTERWVPGMLGAIPRLRRTKRIATTLPIADAAYRYAAWLEVFTEEMRRDLLQPSWSARMEGHDPRLPYRRYYQGPSVRSTPMDHVNRLLYMDVKTWLPDTFLEKLDKASMAWSLEGRLPFLDHRLVELAFQIPARHKIRGVSTTKRILREALRGMLPDLVFAKPKHGFAVPTDPWFRGPLRTYLVEVLTDPATERRGYFDPAVVRRMCEVHSDGREVLDTPLWLLLNFELWHRAYLDTPPVAA